jgi:hypothetical protein
MKSNDWHGLARYDTKEQNKSRHFKSLADLQRVLNEMLIAHGVKLHPSEQTRLLYQS